MNGTTQGVTKTDGKEKLNAFLSVVPFFYSIVDKNQGLLAWCLNQYFAQFRFSETDLSESLKYLLHKGWASMVVHTESDVTEYVLDVSIETRIKTELGIKRDNDFEDTLAVFNQILAKTYYEQAAKEDYEVSHKAFLLIETEIYDFARSVKLLLVAGKPIKGLFNCVVAAHKYFHREVQQEYFTRQIMKWLNKYAQQTNESYWRNYLLVLNELIEQLIETGKKEEIKSLISKGLTKIKPYEQILSTGECIRFYINWARFLMENGNVAEASGQLEKAECFVYGPDDMQLINIWTTYVSYSDLNGESIDKTLDYCHKIRILAQRHGNKLEEAGAIISMAVLLIDQPESDVTYVRSLFDQAMELYEIVGGELDQDGRLFQILRFLVVNDDLGKADKLIKRHLEFVMDGRYVSKGAELYSNLGYVHSLRQEFVESIENFEKALTIYEEHRNEFKVAWVHLLLCESCGLAEEGQKAVFHGQEALRLFSRLENEELLMDSYNELGYVLLLTHRYAEAKIIYTEALWRSMKLADMHVRIWANYGLGEAYRLMDQNDKAFQHWKEAISLNIHSIDSLEEFGANFIDAFVFALKKLNRNARFELREVLLQKFSKSEVEQWVNKAHLKIKRIEGLENEFD